jgi:hypothetical protein
MEAQPRSQPERGQRDLSPGEPAGDDVVKRNIERQVRNSVGDRLRSFEVRVTGRNVLIVAKPYRFWQARGIRRTLEALPVPSGYRARVEVAD